MQASSDLHASFNCFSLFDQAPASLVCDLTSVPAARATMSWQGQAEQPMMPRGRSVCAGVPDSQGSSPWTRLAGRVWFAAVWPQSMHSGASPRLYGKPVWWAPRHGSVAGSGQVRVCAAGIGPLESGLVSLKHMQRRRGGALAPLRTSTIRPKTRGRAAGRLSRARPV